MTGPTAVGKTAVGLELAQRLGGEVISADSVQVYRKLDVGSDKVTGSRAVWHADDNMACWTQHSLAMHA